MLAKGIFRRRHSSKSLHRGNCTEKGRSAYEPPVISNILFRSLNVMEAKEKSLNSLYSRHAKNDMPQELQYPATFRIRHLRVNDPLSKVLKVTQRPL